MELTPTMELEDRLCTAAACGRTAEVEQLLADGADVNGRNKFGRTALQVMMMGSTPVARLLLSHGANPNVDDVSTGATPLHDAARTGFVMTVRLLVEHGADPGATDHKHRRPVDVATVSEVAAFLMAL